MSEMKRALDYLTRPAGHPDGSINDLPRAPSPRVVFTNGCWDGLHVGHARLLLWAKSQGTRLVVGVNSDESVERIKGRPPLYPEGERVEMLLHLKSVDAVFIFPEDTPERLIREVRPDIIVKGPEYRDQEVVGRDLVDEVLFPPWEKEHSTSDIVAAVLARANNDTATWIRVNQAICD